MNTEIQDEFECPHCGESLFAQGLDLLRRDDGARLADWMPCCQALREQVECEGWEAVFGCSLEDAIEFFFAMRPKHMEFDSLLVFPLVVVAPGPGIKGWQAEVFAIIDEHHSHHDAPQGWKFGVAVHNGETRVGVATVGRPVSRRYEQAHPEALEVTRVCCYGDSRLRRNAASKLYSACAAEARKLGYQRLITYTLADENAASVKAANFKPVATTKGGSWGRDERPREDHGPTGKKVRWELEL